MEWPSSFQDPSGVREIKPRSTGKTMVIDKGLGMRAFTDLLETSANYVDVIKLGFGTAALYPPALLQEKIALARKYDVDLMPGGTFLEVAVQQNKVTDYLDTVERLGFTMIEVSDGTIDLERGLRSELIKEGIERGFEVMTEYGKKSWGSSLVVADLIETVHIDTACGAMHVIVEGRESGVSTGVYDEQGKIQEEQMQEVISLLPDSQLLLWETPLKSQQVQMIQLLGPQIHLGNIRPEDALALEALRRGLRSDTFALGKF